MKKVFLGIVVLSLLMLMAITKSVWKLNSLIY